MTHNIDNIIARILSGESSSDDFLVFSDWLQKDEKNKTEFRQLKTYWDAEVSYTNHIAREVELKRIQEKIRKEEQRKRTKRLWIRMAPIAAGFTLFLLIGSLCFFQNKKEVKPLEYYTYVTGDNESRVTLSDGTKVILNKNSKLTYTNLFGQGLRDVELKGEAYFEVTKDPHKVFEVKLNKASIRVLGTKFNVKASSGNKQIVATLVEGCIRFESGEQKVQLSPSQQLIYNSETRKIDVNNVETNCFTAWKDGLVKYKSRPLKEVITSLESKYNVKIKIENPKYENIIVSGSFSNDQSIEETLTVISGSLPIKWIKNDGIYYIR